jgi:hypothetical protein
MAVRAGSPCAAFSGKYGLHSENSFRELLIRLSRCRCSLVFENAHPTPRLSGLRPPGSGSRDSSRMPNDKRFSLAAVVSRERASTTFHPKGAKNSGPSRGANLNGEPA